MRELFQAVAVGLMLLPTCALAQDFEKGVSAYDAGDYEAALRELRPIAEEGFDGAQFYLGQMYIAGQGVVRDEVEAERWLRLAAEQDDALSQVMLGLILSKGEVIEQNEAEAVYWFRRAAKQDLPLAQLVLGGRYEKGNVVPQDYTEATRLYQLAAKQGLARAQLQLGWSYEVGHGVLQDNETAHMWYNISAASEGGDSAKYRDRIAERMTPANINEAQRRARVCMASDYQDCDWRKHCMRKLFQSSAFALMLLPSGGFAQELKPISEYLSLPEVRREPAYHILRCMGLFRGMFYYGGVNFSEEVTLRNQLSIDSMGLLALLLRQDKYPEIVLNELASQIGKEVEEISVIYSERMKKNYSLTGEAWGSDVTIIDDFETCGPIAQQSVDTVSKISG